jgi:aminoglycoside 6'-N-acetyltransferase I
MEASEAREVRASSFWRVVIIANRQRHGQFVAYSASREAVGLVEASVRHEYVNGTESSPVAFLEGLYVVSQAHRKGIAASLMATVCEWAKAARCGELASDAVLENSIAHVVHRALGFEETERVVFFRRKLA